MAKQVDSKKVLQAARNGIPLTVKSYTLPHDTEVYLEEILGIFLKEMGQDKLRDALAYCLRELAVNAKKANTKRVYFKEKGLDILKEDEYKQGMTHFKQETLENINHYLELQKGAGLYIKVIFHAKGQLLNLFIVNNSAITKKEQIRIYDRIARSRAFDSLEEALSTVLDDSEGAGLGIVILVLMLKKIGLDEDAFDIDTENGETVARLTVPMSQVRLENLDMMSQEIVKEIESLPQFPENVTQLQHMISNPETNIQDIARQVSMDPSLTADLLKQVNSAQFMLPKKVDNIVEAVKYMGMRGIKNLLYSYGTQRILGTDSPDTKQLWEHSYRTAFYAYSIARNLMRKKEILDDVYVGGILHDMGKIIFSSVHPDLIKKITRFCREKSIPADLFEDLSTGLNHSEIGALIAEKWNFPDPLVSAIRYHHNPNSAPQSDRDVVYAVYMANAFCNYEEGGVAFDQFDPKVLRALSIADETHLERMSSRLSEAFQREAVL